MQYPLMPQYHCQQRTISYVGDALRLRLKRFSNDYTTPAIRPHQREKKSYVAPPA